MWAHFSNKDVLCTVYVDQTWWDAISEFWHDGWQTVMGTKRKFHRKGKGKGKEKKGVAGDGKGDGEGDGKTILLQPDANAHYGGVIGRDGDLTHEKGKGKGKYPEFDFFKDDTMPYPYDVKLRRVTDWQADDKVKASMQQASSTATA